MNANSNTVCKQYNVEITTSPDFIQMMGKKLYTNPLLAILVRELLQNSRDATSTGLKTKGTIKIDVRHDLADNRKTFVSCDDTGCGMDEETLVGTFLQIGGSKKQDGSVGGFGVAKVSLFATGTWSVTTRNNFVDQSLMYRKTDGSRKGTMVMSTVTHNNDYSQDSDIRLAELFVKSSEVKNVWYNGEKVRAYKPRRMLDLHNGAMISTAPKLLGVANKVFFRIRGLTQYIDDLGYGDDFGFNVIVDFNAIGYKPKDENYPFDAAREKCSREYLQFVRQAVAPLAKNVLTARKEHAEKQVRERIQHRAKTSKKAYIIVDAPKNIQPIDRVILQTWREICDAMNSGLFTSQRFEYGLTYDEDTGAEYRKQDGHTYLLINAEQVRKEWTMKVYNPKDCVPFIMSMWHLAVHEMTHSAGYHDHDENFTSAEHNIARNTSGAIMEHLDPLRAQARRALKGIVEMNMRAGNW